MRILVCGDRSWRDAQRIHTVIWGLWAEETDLVVVHGGAAGADTCAAESAKSLGIPCEEFKADWKQYGRAAGPIRNRQMLDTKPDRVIAFHANLEKSRGTKDCVKEALRRDIPVDVIRS